MRSSLLVFATLTVSFACKSDPETVDGGGDAAGSDPDAGLWPDAVPLRDLPPALELEAEERSVAAAVCAAFERCEAAIARPHANETACARAIETEIEVAILSRAPRVESSTVAGCAAAIDALTDCLVIARLLEEAPPACAKTPGPWKVELAAGEECGLSGACGTGDCAWDTARGPECRSCSAPRVDGESCGFRRPCIAGTCDELRCDEGLACSDRSCVEDSSIEGRACASGADCPDLLAWRCANSQCSRRVVGSPCYEPTVLICGAPGLVCVAGACAEPVGTGGACASSVQCASASDHCGQGTCKPRKTRGAPCTVNDECAGFLACAGGTCAELPVEGQPCEDRCASGLVCLAGECASPATVARLSEGQPCQEECGATCLRELGLCGAGLYCDQETNSCVRFVPVGQSCASGTCDPSTSFCLGSCVAWGQLGEACDTRPCRAGLACLAGTCATPLADGSPCTWDSQCAGGLCYGTCSGGLNHGRACTTAVTCAPDGICYGRCGGPDRLEPRCN
ncbi:MAG: hypothetical protein HYV07_19955 [Deltaproteobacteria bacterium]|nr:hypothetical protein [Deltaproteobacteria bacterium]